jgi:hypothetical protein
MKMRKLLPVIILAVGSLFVLSGCDAMLDAIFPNEPDHGRRRSHDSPVPLHDGILQRLVLWPGHGDPLLHGHQYRRANGGRQ